ncbi:hypothetical protein [Psychrobacillus sp. FSL H8-0487]|uniref:hypothetical protein n=1 Tax=Psychrobacillus sp. FSL H8-0487 TaxID=2921391 RepID=UPI0030FB4F09
MGTDFKVLLGKQNKNEIQLPILYFVAVNQWIEIIGDTAFLSWLKLYTWTKQEDTFYNSKEFTDLYTLTYSFSVIAKKLGIANETLQNKVLIPLWNVGLIDIIEKDNTQKLNDKEVLIIVYRYPKNKLENSFKPIEIFRNYEKDYTKNNRVFHQSKITKPVPDIKDYEGKYILNVLEKHKTRLANDQIDIRVILDLWTVERNSIEGLLESEFANMIDDVLKYTKDKIGSKGSVKGFFTVVLQNFKARKNKDGEQNHDG